MIILKKKTKNIQSNSKINTAKRGRRRRKKGGNEDGNID